MNEMTPKAVSDSIIIEQVLHSNTLYRKMIVLLDTMLTPSSTSDPANHLQSKMENFTKLQLEIINHEHQVDENLKNLESRSNFLDSALVKRKELIADVLTRNREVTSQARAIQSLLGNEIQSMRKGHTALSGYKQQAATTGNFSQSL